ncbi:hypothetical protein D9M68_712710 [compost metagenome]
MTLFAHDGNVGPHRAKVALGRRLDLLPEAVILVDQVHLLHCRIARDVGRQREHAHVHMRIEPEMPERAARLGEVGVDRLVVQVQNLASGIAFVVGVHRLDQAGNDGRTATAGEVLDATLGGLTKDVQRFLGLALGIKHRDLELDVLVVHIELIHGCLQRVHVGFPLALKRARQRFELCDADDLLRPGIGDREYRGGG